MPGLLSVTLLAAAGVVLATPVPGVAAPPAGTSASAHPAWTLQVAQADDSLGSLNSLEQPDATAKAHKATPKPKHHTAAPIRHVHKVVAQSHPAAPKVVAARVVKAPPPRIQYVPQAITPPPTLTPLETVKAMPVTVALPDGIIDPKYTALANALPQAPVTINPMTLQSVLNGSLPAPPDSPLAARVRDIYRHVEATPRAPDAPAWKDGIVPTVWFGQTKRTAGDWWQSFKSTPAVLRSFPVEMFPFAYDFDTEGSSSGGHAQARALNNQALDALFIDGDTDKATSLLDQAVKSDTTYAYGPYNTGVLMMCLHNQPDALKMFALFDERRGQATSAMQTTESAFERNMRSPGYTPSGPEDQKRETAYDEDVSAAWALFNVGQWRAAALFAGQAASIESGPSRPEAPLIAAMICAEVNDAAATGDWLFTALANTTEPATRNSLLAEIEYIKRISPSAVPVPTNPVAQNPAPTAQPASPQPPNSIPLPPAADSGGAQSANPADPGAAGGGNPADPGAAGGTSP